jgi:carboxyl-terminal processing protease
MNAKQRKCVTVFFACLCVFPRPALADDASEIAPEIRKILDAFTSLDREAASPVDARTAFYQGAIPAMLRTLDPHSIFFDPDQFQQLQQMQESERQGFGTIVSILPGRVLVLQVLEGAPASRAGLAAGDEILAINGLELAYYNVEQLTQLLQESRQKQVTLHVRHPGGSSVDVVTMSPDLLEVPSVDRAFAIAPDVGYVRVANFEQATGQLVRREIEEFGGEYLKGLILDLRGNPGGVVAAAIETASLFLAPDQLVFSIQGRNRETEDVYVPKSSRPYTFPVAVLLNGKSASASEIVAGALQDHDRAVVLGEPSYGKGLVQQVYPLSAGTGAALTVAFYYTPSGRSIQKPLSGVQLGASTLMRKGPYRSDSGRTLMGGGGIQPDHVILPAPQSQLQAVIDGSGLLTSFAGQYLRTHPVKEGFEITSEMLDDLRVFLALNRVQPGPAEWTAHRPWILERLRQEIVTLAFGVARGEELELRRDPVVQAALKWLSGGGF